MSFLSPMAWPVYQVTREQQKELYFSYTLVESFSHTLVVLKQVVRFVDVNADHVPLHAIRQLIHEMFLVINMKMWNEIKSNQIK